VDHKVYDFHKKIGNDVAKGKCHNINVKLVVDSDGWPLGNDRITIQIAELLCKEDVALEWMFLMRAWHITQVFMNGASLYDHKKCFIYKTALHYYITKPQRGVRYYDSSRQRQENENPPKKVVKLSAQSINFVASSTCCRLNYI
jgi:hypothetical protein